MEWLDPVYIGGHWTPQLIEMAGGHHVLSPPTILKSDSPNVKTDGSDSSPEHIPWRHIQGAPPSVPIPIEKITSHKYDLILIAPCGLDLTMIEKELVRMYSDNPDVCSWWVNLIESTETWLIDGNQHFNRPGHRLVDALEFLVDVIHSAPSGLESPPYGFPAKRIRSIRDIMPPTSLETPEGVLDIEEIHNEALGKGLDMYTDPVTGYRVLTSKFLSDRGTCCGNACRHCRTLHLIFLIYVIRSKP
jgi:hypothetical protein